ncbi:MAG: hypothetical protein ACLFR8_02310, partial [Alkalispirochaeta sp.]
MRDGTRHFGAVKDTVEVIHDLQVEEVERRAGLRSERDLRWTIGLQCEIEAPVGFNRRGAVDTAGGASATAAGSASASV